MFGAWAEMIVIRGDQKSRKGKTTRKENIFTNIANRIIKLLNEGNGRAIKLLICDSMKDSDEKLKFKICMAGNPNVGRYYFFDSIFKSINTNIDNNVSKNYIIYGSGIIFNTFDLMILETKVRLLIWEIIGGQTLNQIKKEYFSGTHAIFFVYDCAIKESIDNLDDWIRKFNENGSESIEVYVFAYNVDSNPTTKSNFFDAKKILAELQIKNHYEITTKLLKDSTDLIEQVAQDLLDLYSL